MGENRYLGQIVATGAGSMNNLATAAPFVIPPGSQVTCYASAAVNLLTDNLAASNTGAQKGVNVAASSNFPTSVGQYRGLISDQPTAVIAVYFSAVSQTVDVWQRSGLE